MRTQGDIVDKMCCICAAVAMCVVLEGWECRVELSQSQRMSTKAAVFTY